MTHPSSSPEFDAAPRRRWPMILAILAVVLAGLWSAAWYYGTGKAEATLAGWMEREAKAGRVYACASQTISGFPFRVQVRCTDPSAEFQSNQPPVALKAKEILVSAQVWQPTALTSEFTGPLMIGEPGKPADLKANWRRAETRLSGLPTAPEKVSIALDDPTVERVGGADAQPLFKAARFEINGRMLEGSASNNPVIEVALKLVQASAPTLHPATVAPLDADITAVLRGLKNFAPKPWPERFRELQAAGGRIEVPSARVSQNETVAVSSGAVGLSQRGRLDGQLRLTVANLEKVLPALGLDRLLAPQPSVNNVGSALDRLGLGNVARQNAGPALLAGLAFIGQQTELEGKRAFALPLRFNDGAMTLGPIPLGQTQPLF